MSTLESVLALYGLSSVYEKVHSNGMSLLVLRWLNMQKDFDNLCEIMGFNDTEKIKFRSMITALQSTRDAASTSDSDRIDAVNQIADDLERDISLHFDGLIAQLQHRKIELLTKVQKWKIEEMNNGDDDISEIQFECSSTLKIDDISGFGIIRKLKPEDTADDSLESEDQTAKHQWNPFCDNNMEITTDLEAKEIDTSTLKPIYCEYVDHRGHFMDDDAENEDLYHPRNLLDLYNNERYYSRKLNSFTMNGDQLENDWIIFRTQYGDQFYIPKVIEIKNHSNEYAVKRMSLFIGDESGTDWIELTPNGVELSNEQLFVQIITLNIPAEITMKSMQDRKLNHFKVELVENWGACTADKARFCLDYIGICFKDANGSKELL